jgi:rare lipoprotein A
VINKLLAILLFSLLLFGCSTNFGRYQQKNDSSPTRLPTASELVDAIPRIEKPSRGGNKDYQVRGKNYQVLSHAQNFTETGIASWYGRKFHGHLTSNGEIYDMYSMSAAHKNLPLPTYVKVVNNSNGRSVIVRVNDRGPFHQKRIIDLSYSAAYKLDMLKTGTANVTISTFSDLNKPENVTQITPLPSATEPQALMIDKQPEAVKKSTATDEFIQVFAGRNALKAQQTANALTKLYQQKTSFPEKNGIFRVLVGPILNTETRNNLLKSLKAQGYPNAFVRQYDEVTLSITN